jgi:hypothetical protein
MDFRIVQKYHIVLSRLLNCAKSFVLKFQPVLLIAALDTMVQCAWSWLLLIVISIKKIEHVTVE